MLQNLKLIRRQRKIKESRGLRYPDSSKGTASSNWPAVVAERKVTEFWVRKPQLQLSIAVVLQTFVN